jgi:ferrous iron transport protein B
VTPTQAQPDSPSPDASQEATPRTRRVLLLGNPNVGKSTIFGRLASARVHTSNFPGTTQSATVTRVGGLELVDLPGIYQLETSPGDDASESAVCRAALAGRLPGESPSRPADTAAIVLDAANLSRNLRLVAEVLRIGLPTVLVLNRIDQAERRGIAIDTEALANRTGCPVLTTNGLTGEGVDAIIPAINAAASPPAPLHDTTIRDWVDATVSACITRGNTDADHERNTERLTDRLDDLFLNPLAGSAVFIVSMTLLFWVVFKLAAYPMDWIDTAFAMLGDAAAGVLPPGAISDLLVNGIIGGVGATVIFLPQICLMFFLITLLEHSGYLPRAALLVDRLFRPFGLPGQAFVPLLSSHACAIPGIIACRGIPDRRERLATILVAPFMSCTARIPVYVLLTSILFADRPALAALAFTGCYVLGATAALLTALVFRSTFLRGSSRSMALELPGYRRPSLRLALIATRDRAWMFLRKAGTVILAMVITLWWLGSYPVAGPEPRSRATPRAGRRHPGRIGARPRHRTPRTCRPRREPPRHRQHLHGHGRPRRRPLFKPLGYDWQLTVGVLSSFAAREVFVSTMAVVTAAGDEDAAESESGLQRIATATRDDGETPVFTTPTSWSLLVFYVLAMQCLPTLAVTARESGDWRWALLQLGYMTALAYVGGLIAFTLAGSLM